MKKLIIIAVLALAATQLWAGESRMTREEISVPEITASMLELQHRVGGSLLTEDREAMVRLFTLERKSFFNPVAFSAAISEMKEMSDEQVDAVLMARYKDPDVALMMSVFFGVCGVDRFYVGDTKLGIIKMLTAGGLGVWWIIDLFQIQDLAKDKNVEIFNDAAATAETISQLFD